MLAWGKSSLQEEKRLMHGQNAHQSFEPARESYLESRNGVLFAFRKDFNLTV